MNIYGFAKEAELAHGKYWQCEEYKASHKKNHPAYRTLQQQTFENIHKMKKSKMNSSQKWNINNGHKYDRTTKLKRRKKTQTEKRPKRHKTKSTTDTTWGDATNPIYTKNRDIPKNLRKLIKDRGEIISVLADGHCLFRAVGKILHMEPGRDERSKNAHDK